MILIFSFNSGIFIQTINNFQNGNKNTSVASKNDPTNANTLNAISATTAPAISPTYQAYGDIVSTTVIQSPHNYPNNANLTYTVNKPGALSITLYFTQISVQRFDYVRIYSKTGNLVQQYTNSNNNNIIVTVNSPTVYIVLTTDNSGTRYGFYVAGEVYNAPLSSTQTSFAQNSINSYNLSYTINEPHPYNYTFYQNNVKVGSTGNFTTNTPFSFLRTNLALGTNNFSLVAFDQSNNYAWANRTITITKSTSTPTIQSVTSTLTENVNYQSDHSGVTTTNSTLKISRPGESYLTISFSSISTTGSGVVNVYDKYDNLVNSYSGGIGAVTVTVNTDTAYVVFSALGSNSYGYAISQLTYPVTSQSSVSVLSSSSVASINFIFASTEINPTTFTFKVNNVQQTSQSYQPFFNKSVTLTGLKSGSNNFTLTLFNSYGLNSSTTFYLTLLNYTSSPVITTTINPYKDITKSVSFQSSHTTRAITTEKYSITNTGANELYLYFSEIQLYSSEKLTITDASGKIVQSYTGSITITNFWIFINSGSVYITLSSTNGYMNGYGFSITSIRYITNFKASSTYYKNQITDMSLYYHINERYPANYTIYANGTSVFSTSSAINSINYNITNFVLGTYNYTIVAFDQNGNNATSQYLFSVANVTNPVFSKIPESIVLTDNNATGTLSWTIQSQNATYYELWINGILVKTGDYTNNTQINYNINLDNSYLTNGTNYVKIIAYNAMTGMTVAEFTVTVIRSYQPISLTATSTISRSIVSAQHPSKASPFPFFASILGLAFSIILFKKRRRRLN